jgi:hypothetical protein
MCGRLHRDQQGTISIVAVFAALMLTVLLGMVMNAGREVDGKIRMQNAADAAAYSGGVTLARGMNSLVFTNHLLCDVFAMTAFMREGQEGNASSYMPDILAAWARVGPIFGSASRYPKFRQMGPAITQEVPLEQNLVDAYQRWAAALAAEVLPAFEQILADELIPKYQRAVVDAYPDIAQQAALAAAGWDGTPDHGRGKMLAAVWQTSGQLVSGSRDASTRVLPVVDPELDNLFNQDDYVAAARQQRSSLSHHYLNDWNNQCLVFFDAYAKMSRFNDLWRGFTCGQLEHLLNVEYPTSNLPFQIRQRGDVDDNTYLDESFTYLALVYWRKMPELAPRIFQNPMDNDAVAYAAVRMFVPRGRLVWEFIGPGGGGGGSPGIGIGGMPGEFPTLPGTGTTGTGGTGSGGGYWIVAREGIPTDWNLLNQSWNCQLVPAVQPALVTILQTQPSLAAFQNANLRMPNLGNLSGRDLPAISMH